MGKFSAFNISINRTNAIEISIFNTQKMENLLEFDLWNALKPKILDKLSLMVFGNLYDKGK